MPNDEYFESQECQDTAYIKKTHFPTALSYTKGTLEDLINRKEKSIFIGYICGGSEHDRSEPILYPCNKILDAFNYDYPRPIEDGHDEGYTEKQIKKAFEFINNHDGNGLSQWINDGMPVPPVNLEAAAILISVEKKHIKMTNYSLWNDLEFDWCYMEGRPDDGDYEEYPSLFENLYPCETLLAARSVASQSTLDYVAEQLKEGK